LINSAQPLKISAVAIERGLPICLIFNLVFRRRYGASPSDVRGQTPTLNKGQVTLERHEADASPPRIPARSRSRFPPTCSRRVSAIAAWREFIDAPCSSSTWSRLREREFRAETSFRIMPASRSSPQRVRIASRAPQYMVEKRRPS